MPSRSKKVAREVARLPSIPKELVSLFLTGPMTGEAINAAGLALKKALAEASLNAELSHHLGYEAGADRPELVTNQRNGSTAKSVLTGDGTIRIDAPRDRDGSFEPVLVPKHARRFTGFDNKVTALYARDRCDERCDGDREGRACAPVPQPNDVLSGLSARDAGDGVRRARARLRLFQRRLHTRHLRQHEDGGGHDLRRQGSAI